MSLGQGDFLMQGIREIFFRYIVQQILTINHRTCPGDKYNYENFHNDA